MDGESPRLVGAHEIRKLLGVSRQRVYQIARRADFPRPIAILAQGKIWNVNDVEAWIAAHRRRPKESVSSAAARARQRVARARRLERASPAQPPDQVKPADLRSNPSPDDHEEGSETPHPQVGR
jgi:predicted DNA-binding transcriptional regulator AlpA